MTNNFIFWQRWLFIFSLLMIAFGLLMALGSSTPLFAVFNQQIDPLFWGSQTIPPEALSFRGWIYGLAGATMAGWGVFSAFLVQNAMRRKEKWAWHCMLTGMLVWYIPDTALSLFYGVVFNAVFNSVLLLMMLLPLLAVRKSMQQNE